VPVTSVTSVAETQPAEAPGLQSKGAQTRRAVLDAAIARFGREGYRATSVADITRDAGVGSTVAYAYFPNKEALFLAALDEDAAAVIEEGLSYLGGDPLGRAVADGSQEPRSAGRPSSHRFPRAYVEDWRQTLIFTLLVAVEHHPLARRLLAGLEPGVTERVLEIPALAQLRKACAERLRAEQIEGTVRADIDPVAVGNGMVSIILSLLMSLVQLGGNVATAYGRDVAAVFEAAIERTPPGT
jgi:AcrR family transcriptional regulator